MTNLKILESPIEMIEGEVITYSIVWEGAASVANPTAAVYRNGEDYTVTAMASGDSHSVSGNVQTLKAITAGAQDGGEEYVVVIQAEVDGNTERRKLVIEILKAET
jgi:hypothetical protein